MQNKILYLIHRLLGSACLIVGTCNAYSLSKSYLLAALSFFSVIFIWNYFVDLYVGPERNSLIENFFSGKISSEELLAKYKTILEPIVHVRTCIYAAFHILTVVFSRCQL